MDECAQPSECKFLNMKVMSSLQQLTDDKVNSEIQNAKL